MAVSTTTTFNDLVGSIVSSQAQSAAYANRVMRPLIRGEAVPPGFQNLTIPRFQKLSVASLAEGVAPASTTWSTDGVTLTPLERGVYVQISKMALHADPFADLSPYGEQMGRAMAEDEDVQVLTEMASFFSSNVANSAGDAVTVDDFADAIGLLEAANAPHPYSAVMHPYSWGKLRKAIDVQGYGSTGERNLQGFGPGVTNAAGFVGSLFGVPIFISSATPSDGAATPTYRKNFVFSREAVGCAWIKDIGVDVDDNVTARALDLMGWYAVDCEGLVDAYGVELRDTLTA